MHSGTTGSIVPVNTHGYICGHTPISACATAIITNAIIAVIASEKPASLALPSTLSVNNVENMAIGASEQITITARTEAENGSRNQETSAKATL